MRHQLCFSLQLLLAAAASAAEPPVPVLQVRDMYPSVSPDGQTLVFESNRSGVYQVYSTRLDADGRGAETRQLTDAALGAETPVISPDGKRIVLAIYVAEGNNDVFVMNIDGSGLKQLTDSSGYDGHPHWSADGKRIVFNSDRSTPTPDAPWGERWHEIFSMDTHGGDVRQHTRCRAVCTYGSLSPDGKTLLYRRAIAEPGLDWALNAIESNSEIVIADLDGSNERNLSQHPAFDGWPAWSPDGTRIAFASNRSGPRRTGQIWAIRPDGSDLRQETDADWSYAQPAWSFDGRSLYAYQSRETAEFEFGSVARLAVRP